MLWGTLALKAYRVNALVMKQSVTIDRSVHLDSPDALPQHAMTAAYMCTCAQDSNAGMKNLPDSKLLSYVAILCMVEAMPLLIYTMVRPSACQTPLTGIPES